MDKQSAHAEATALTNAGHRVWVLSAPGPSKFANRNWTTAIDSERLTKLGRSGYRIEYTLVNQTSVRRIEE